MAGANIPSKQVGGDYYDYVELGDEVLFVVGDVVGKGVPAALLMSMLQASLRTMATEGHSLSEMARRLNRLILRAEDSGKFATLFLGRFHLQTLKLQYSNAGHNPPVLVRPDGKMEWLSEGGLLLGAFEDPRPQEGTVQMGGGDRLILYTDGVTEAENPNHEFFGEERLEETLRNLDPTANAEQILESITNAVREFEAGEEASDDMTIVVLRIPVLVSASV